MTASYDYWTRRLAGEKIVGSVDDPQFGFFKSKQGKGKDSTYLPLAIFADGDGIMGVIGTGSGARVLRDDKLCHEWNYSNSRVISEEEYRFYERNGDWPNADPTTSKQRKDSAEHLMRDAEGNTRDPRGPQGSINSSLFAQIETAKKGAPTYYKIEDDTAAAKGQDLRSNLTTLAGKLDKEREALVRPHLDAQQEINGRFNPTIKSAKAEADRIRDALSAWETLKRNAAVEAARRAEEAAQKAATEGLPAPAPAQTNAPAPQEQIRGATGRAAHVGTKKVITAIDVVKVCEQFKGKQELIDWMTTYAQRAVNAGITVEGVSVEEVADVK